MAHSSDMASRGQAAGFVAASKPTGLAGNPAVPRHSKICGCCRSCARPRPWGPGSLPDPSPSACTPSGLRPCSGAPCALGQPARPASPPPPLRAQKGGVEEYHARLTAGCLLAWQHWQSCHHCSLRGLACFQSSALSRVSWGGERFHREHKACPPHPIPSSPLHPAPCPAPHPPPSWTPH